MLSATERPHQRRLIAERTGALAVAAAPLLILATALVLRLDGLQFGLPHIGYYWDEPAVVNHAVQFASGDLNPHWFYYPAFFMYLALGAIGAFGAIGLATGRFAGVDDFVVAYFLDPTGHYVAARMVSVVAGVATVFLLAKLGERLVGPRAGWLAAMLLAISPLHAGQSHVAVTDIAFTFWFVAAAWSALRVVDGGGRRHYLMTGAAIGLGAATKYLTVLAVPALVLAHLLRTGSAHTGAPAWRRIVSLDLALGLLAVLVAFTLASPFNVLDAGAFLRDAREQAAVSSGGDRVQGALNSLGAFPSDLGWAGAALALVGGYLIVKQRGRRGLVVLAVPALYLLFMLAFPRGFARYMLPVTPFAALAAGAAIDRLWRAIEQRSAPALLRGTTVALLLAIAVVPPLAATMTWITGVARATDTRTEALDWIEANVASNTAVAVQSLFDKTYQNVPLVTDASIEAVGRDIPSTGRFNAIRSRVLEALGRGPVYHEVPFVYDFDRLRAQGARLIITSDQNWQATLNGTTAPDSPDARFLADLNAHARLVREFRPAPEVRHTPWYRPVNVFPYVPPTISVYEVTP